MPIRSIRDAGTRAPALRLAALATALFCGGQAVAATLAEDRAAAAKTTIENSRLDAPLFYELLIGELELGTGDLGTAFQVLLDASKRTKDEQLFQRTTQIALQGRAGDQALAAVRAWRVALPQSLEAMRYEVQLLVALNRPAEAVAPMQALIRAVPENQRASAISSVPGLLARSEDKNASATLVEKTVQPFADAPATRTVARVTIGRAWLAAGDTAKATEIARTTHAADRAAEAPAVLALELPPGPEADAIVTDQLAAQPSSDSVRLLYVRSLLARQRFPEATAQLETLTRNAPQLPQAWLTLGALHLQLRETAEANTALLKYIDLVQADPSPPPADAPVSDAADPPATKEEALARGWILLSQVAEQQGDLPAAAAWLAKIDDPKRLVEVQTRRASMLARQGKVAEAREMIRQIPERSAEDQRAKLLAEAEVLRDAKLWSDANTVLAQANQKFPDDTDLLYEQSMVLEKLDRLDEMERLLRRVIALKPDYQHAYNALGYSLAEHNTRLPEARTLIQKALELSPGEPAITDSLGWVEYKLGHNDEAVRLLRDAYRSQPDAEIAAHLGEVLWVSGRSDEALSVFREARGRDAGNVVLRETLARLRVDL